MKILFGNLEYTRSFGFKCQSNGDSDQLLL